MAKKTPKRRTKEQLEKAKQLAYAFFMNTEKTQKEIADLVDVSEPTMTKWATDGGWSEIKALEKASKGATIKRIYDKIFDLAQSDDPNAADKASKWAAVLEKFEQKKVTVPNMINALTQFGNWLFPKKADLAKELNKYMQEFVNEKINE